MPLSRARRLVNKSVSAMISAIEIYNKPNYQYREETFSIHDLKEKGHHRYTLSPQDLLSAAATSGSVGIVFSFIATFSSLLDDLLPGLDPDKWLGRYAEPSVKSVLVMVVILALFSWLISIIGTMFKYANFTLFSTEDKIYVTRGLLERQELTIPRKKIQAVRISEGLLRQPFGLASVVVASAGQRSEKEGAAVLWPLIKKEKAHALLQEIVPEFAVDEDLKAVPVRALPRYIFRWVLAALIPVIPLTVFVPFGYLSMFVVIIAFVYGVLRYKDAGWAVRDNKLLLRYRTIARNTVFIPVRRIQSIEMSQSWMQKRKELATFRVHVASGNLGTSFSITDLEDQDIKNLLSSLQR